MSDAERVHYRNHAPIVLGIATNAPITHELELAFDKALTEWQQGNCHDLEGCRCITAYMMRHVMPVIRSERERVREGCANEAERWAENYPETVFTPINTEEVWKPDMSETILSNETGRWITRASADSARNSAKCIAENIRGQELDINANQENETGI